MNPPSTVRPWWPSFFVLASGALHAAIALALLLMPAWWPAWLAALALNHVAIAAAGLWPRSTWLGPNLLRLPQPLVARHAVCLTIDDGPDPAITPQVLTLLAEHKVRATFFCIGERMLAQPELTRAIAAAGHSLGNHSQHHRHHFSVMGPLAIRRQVAGVQEAALSLGLPAPRFFRAPAGLRNIFLEPVLCALGLHLASWTRRAFDTRCGDADVVYQRLIHNLAAGDILLLHDSHCALTAEGQPVILGVLPRLLATLKARDFHCVTLDEIDEALLAAAPT